MDLLKVRKATPQYLLLHGNTPLSSSSSTSKILSTLTSDTWGLSLSLKDISEVAYDSSSNTIQQNNTSKSKGGKVDETKGIIIIIITTIIIITIIIIIIIVIIIIIIIIIIKVLATIFSRLSSLTVVRSF